MPDQGWNVVKSVPDAATPATPAAGGWNVVASQPDQGAAPPAQPLQPYAAQPTQMSGGLPHPDLVAQVTSAHAQTLAAAILAPPPTQAQRDFAPGIPTPPIPYDLQTDQQRLAAPGAPTFQNPRTGRSSVRQEPGIERGPLSVLDMPVTGVQKMGEGVAQMAQPEANQKVGGVSKIVRGGFEAATPFSLPKMAATPLVSAASVGMGMVAQDAVEKGLKKLGLPPGWAAIAGDVAGVIAGVGTHAKLTPKSTAALKAKYEPILKARADKVNAPPPPGPTANSTGTEPYQPASAPPPRTPAPAPSIEPPAPSEPTAAPPPAAPVQGVSKTPQSKAAEPAPPGWNVVRSTRKPADLEAKLPAALRGAKPRYSYGPKQFDLSFQSDLDRAAYITAQNTRSKGDAGYLKFVMDATGESEEAVRRHGADVRAALKAQAKNEEAGTLNVPDMARHRFGAKEIPAQTIAAQPSQHTINPARASNGNEEPGKTDHQVAGPGQQGRQLPEAADGVRGPGTGHRTSVLVPDSDVEHPATYRVRELGDLKASHHGFSFQENPDYPYTNDRDYTKAENQKRVILQAQKFNPRYLVTDNPDTGNGPPVVDTDGNALGGNSRVMTMQRVYAQHPEASASYRAHLRAQATHYGIDPADIDAMKQPVLVREISRAEAAPMQRAITDFNRTGTAKLGPSEQALVDSKRVSADTLEAIQHHIAKHGEDGSLAKALASDDGIDIVNRLVADGAIAERERPQYVADGKVTPEGKTRLGRLMIGRLFSDVNQFDETPAGIKNKLERIVSPLARLEARPEWDASMNANIRGALQVMQEAASRDFSKLEDLDSQQGMFGARKFGPDAYRWAYVLKNNSMRALGNAFKAYAERESRSRPDTTADMFAPPPVSQAEAFAETIGKLKNIDRKIDVEPGAPPAKPPAGASPAQGEQSSVAEPAKRVPLTLQQLPEYAQDAFVRHSMMRRTNEQHSKGPWPHEEVTFRKETVPLESLRHRNEMLFEKGSTFQHRGSMTKGPIAVNERGEVIDGNNRTYEAVQRGDKHIEIFRAVPKSPEQEKSEPAVESNSKRGGPPAEPPANPPAGTSPAQGAQPTATPPPAPPPVKAPSGPVTMGAGLGAFEPFLRESIEDMRAMKVKRDAAIEALERSKITKNQWTWGEQVRRYFTSERDVWTGRANQGIAKVRKLTLPSKNRRTGVDLAAEAVAIAREFKQTPAELQTILDGSHPDLARIQDPNEFKRVMDRIQALRPAIERAQKPMDAAMKAVDQFYTNMASTTGAEGKRVGNLDATWNPETYVPHVLHPKGEGGVATPRQKMGQALGGRIGKYFGFSERRAYPTLLHAIMADVIPKTMNVHDAFTIQQDNFATSRATRLLEDTLKNTSIGKYTVKANAPEDWVPIAPQSNEFRALVPYDSGTIDEAGQPVLDVAEKRLFVPKFIEQSLRPITSPDFTTEIMAVNALRVTQAATKAAQLGLSFFHATTENYMALANMGPKGWIRALRADRESAQFLLAERDLIAHGGTSSIQGNTVEAYHALQPGSIPTYGDIWRQNAAVKIMDQAAKAISDFTFANLQRRFKVTDYQMHVAAWMAKNPAAWGRDVMLAKQSIAKEVNAIYGGLHWENLGLNKSTIEIARAVMLAPDWTLSNIFNVKYAFEKGPGGRMARMFWARTLTGGLVATQLASLLFSGRPSPRPTMVYMGHDSSGREIYQNIFFKGAPGDATNLVTNVYDYGLQGIARTLAGKGAPAVRTALQLISNRDYLGHEIAPKGMNPVASSVRTTYSAAKSMLPVPLSLTNQADMLFGPEAHKYKLAESLTTMFSGNPPSHVPPSGTHMTDGVLRPNAPREENSALQQAISGSVYKKRAKR